MTLTLLQRVQQRQRQLWRRRRRRRRIRERERGGQASRQRRRFLQRPFSIESFSIEQRVESSLFIVLLFYNYRRVLAYRLQRQPIKMLDYQPIGLKNSKYRLLKYFIGTLQVLQLPINENNYLQTFILTTNIVNGIDKIVINYLNYLKLQNINH